MKTYLAKFPLLLFVVAVGASGRAHSQSLRELDGRDSAIIISQEKSYWDAYSSGDTFTLAKLLSPGFVNLEGDIFNSEQLLTFITRFHQSCHLPPVAVSDIKLIAISPDAATIVYHAVESPTCGTHKVSGASNVSTLWVRRDGQWKMQVHTESTASAK